MMYCGQGVPSGLPWMRLLAYGRPAKVELMVLIDRRFSRQLPIEPNYIGHQVDSLNSQMVRVSWKETEGEDKVILISESNK